ncbi:putative alpha beta hydrolase fold protein [Lyophyllum shimeji]|uniref:Alpha beta hydrolase fold protein n=1 Tax=Lyophyllum shimeji TaxID=47721 RepID=A0A9P3UU81_LYOSH|nr:putative alpha beta hydrolase fold protein [Lyophyllum shimeji]
MVQLSRRTYGQVSWTEIVSLALVLARLPLILLWSLFKASFVPSCKTHKSWRRVLGDTAFRHLADSWNVSQFQYYLGPTLQVYAAWAKKEGLSVLVDEIGEGARLLWIGPRRADRVVLYFHGGGYLVPLSDFAASFWNYVRLELARDGLDVGFAILNYSIVPTASFPQQLIQAVKAIQHVIDSGCSPQNIQIVGDSAGANLALAFLSHMIHPVKGIQQVSLPSRIRGVYLMSPWVSLTGDTGSHAANDHTDVVGAATFAECGRNVFENVPESLRVYLEARKAPEAWFKGVDGIVDRILVTAGGAECLRDNIVKVANRLVEHHQGAVRLIVQEKGVHNDPFYDFLAREKNLCYLTPEVVQWVRDGFVEGQAC